MIIIPNRDRWQRQPQGRVEVDWSHPLANGLMAGMLVGPTGVQDVINSSNLIAVTGTGVSVSASTDGYAASTTGTTSHYQTVTPIPPISTSTGGSIFVRAQVSAIASGTNFANRAVQLFNGSQPVGVIDFGSQSAGATVLDTYWQRTSSAFAIKRSPSSFVVAGNTYNVLSAQPAGTGTTSPNLYSDGVAITSGVGFGSANPLVATPTSLRILAQGANATQWLRGGVYVAYAWSKPLGLAEARALHDNPYQFLKTRNRVFFIPEAIEAAGGTANGTTLTATASLIAGVATGSASRTGTTLTLSNSLITGVATGGASKTGSTLTATVSLIAGTASGTSAATANGVLLTATASLITGTATGSASRTGTTLTASASLIAGAATGGATKAGSVLGAAATVVPGSATGSASKTGVVLTTSTSLVAGTASGGASTSGAVLTATLSFLTGEATGEINYDVVYVHGQLVFKPQHVQSLAFKQSPIETLVFAPSPVQRLTQLVD